MKTNVWWALHGHAWSWLVHELSQQLIRLHISDGERSRLNVSFRGKQNDEVVETLRYRPRNLDLRWRPVSAKRKSLPWGARRSGIMCPLHRWTAAAELCWAQQREGSVSFSVSRGRAKINRGLFFLVDKVHWTRRRLCGEKTGEGAGWLLLSPRGKKTGAISYIFTAPDWRWIWNRVWQRHAYLTREAHKTSSTACWCKKNRALHCSGCHYWHPSRRIADSDHEAQKTSSFEGHGLPLWEARKSSIYVALEHHCQHRDSADVHLGEP